VLVVLGKYVPQLRFLDVLLGDEPVLSPPMRLYQRMLALDQEEVLDVVQEYFPQLSLEEIYDTILLPAMALAEQDRHRGRLDDRRQAFIRQSMRELIDELGDQFETMQVKQAAADVEEAARSDEKQPSDARKSHRRIPKDCSINVVCLPAHDEADEIVGLMLAQLLSQRGYCAFPVSNTALASEMMEQVEQKRADLVVVSALPPAAVAHGRYLCKRVHLKFPDMRMIVGLWNFRGEIEKAKDRITCVGAVQVVTSLSSAQETIDQLLQSAIVAQTTPTETRDDSASRAAAAQK
jgi:hypothetical protein